MSVDAKALRQALFVLSLMSSSLESPPKLKEPEMKLKEPEIIKKTLRNPGFADFLGPT